MSEKEKVITRIAPSPTGNLHVGTARSALFNYLYARKHNGSFIVRIEDTDKARSTKEFENNILEGLSWLGLEYDEIFRQSERGDIYSKYIEQLLESDKAYLSKEDSKQKKDEKVEVVRLRNPGKKIIFNDSVRGDITFDTSDLGDFVIARTKTDPLYHFVVVVDDELMNVTHILRGDDHISNTPRQILIQEALGFSRPKYTHLPLLLAPDRSKLSKRKGETSISKYAEEFLPDALVNYLALLGWNPGTEQEIFSKTDLIETFDIDKVQKGGAIFDIEKLKSINHEYLKKLPKSEFKEKVLSVVPKKISTIDQYSERMIDNILPTIQERARTSKEIESMFAEGELTFYFVQPKYEIKNALWKNDGEDVAKKHLTKVKELLEKLPSTDFNEENVKTALWDYASEMGRGSVLWPFRYILTGLEKSPDPFNVASALGKDEVVLRIETALKQL